MYSCNSRKSLIINFIRVLNQQWQKRLVKTVIKDLKQLPLFVTIPFLSFLYLLLSFGFELVLHESQDLTVYGS